MFILAVASLILFFFGAGCTLNSLHPDTAVSNGPGPTEKVKSAKGSGLSDIAERVCAGSVAIDPVVAPSGSRISLTFTYTVSGADAIYPVSQEISIVGPGINTELLKRRFTKRPGRHVSRVKVLLPRDSDPGNYLIVTRFATGQTEAVAKGSFRIVRPRSGLSPARGSNPSTGSGN